MTTLRLADKLSYTDKYFTLFNVFAYTMACDYDYVQLRHLECYSITEPLTFFRMLVFGRIQISF